MSSKTPLLFGTAALIAMASLSPFASSAQAQEFTAEQQAKIQEMIQSYILENGDTVIKAVEAHQHKQARAQEEQAKKALEGTGDLVAQFDAPFVGPEDASVTVVEFFDYNCGYCKRALNDVQAVLKDDKDVKIVFMEMPILGPTSLVASKWSFAASKQDKYFEFHTELMNHKGPKNDSEMRKLGKKVGLDVHQLEKDANDPATDAAIRKKVDFATTLGVRGTPAFIIGKELVRGYIGTDGMKAKIAENRKKG